MISKRDLAVLRICCRRFTAFSFGDAENVAIGEVVVNMGYALGKAGAATVTTGIVLPSVRKPKVTLNTFK